MGVFVESETRVVPIGSPSATEGKCIFSSLVPISESVSNHCRHAFCCSGPGRELGSVGGQAIDV